MSPSAHCYSGALTLMASAHYCFPRDAQAAATEVLSPRQKLQSQLLDFGGFSIMLI